MVGSNPKIACLIFANETNDFACQSIFGGEPLKLFVSHQIQRSPGTDPKILLTILANGADGRIDDSSIGLITSEHAVLESKKSSVVIRAHPQTAVARFTGRK